MTIGGGMSWFGRATGLGANSIVAATLVDGFGGILHVSADQNPELFWAIRGGGGDFAMITSLTLALHPVPQVYGGRLMWPIEQMPVVLRAFAQVCRTAPEELTLWYHTYRFPPMPELPEPIRGKAFAGVALAFLGGRDDAEPWLEPLRKVPGLQLDLLGDVALRDLGTIAAEPVDPMPSLEFSTFLTDLSAETLDTLTGLTGADSGSAAGDPADPPPRRGLH